MPVARPVRLHVLLTEDEMAVLRKVADDQSVTVADIVRRFVQKLRKEPKLVNI